MSSSSRRRYERNLRRYAVLMWILCAAAAVAAGICITMWRNPWSVKKFDAGKTEASTLEEIAGSTSPYVQISGIDLSYTGFYEIDEKDVVRSYCYMGTVGDRHILVDMPVTDSGRLAQDSEAEGSKLENTVVKGQADVSGAMLKYLAEDEGMSVEDYSSKYRVSPLEIHVYRNDRERVRIYQLMLFVLVIGFMAAGVILWSEAGSSEE